MLQHLTTNLSGTVRHDKMEGRDYLVAPMVMLCEGVHAGSKGPLYYSPEEMAKNIATWNYRPVVVYHPTENGAGVSAAANPETLTKHKVGVIMNTRYKSGKLLAEAWLEVSRLEEVDSRVLTALEADEMMELSTGLFTDDIPKAGTWNGEDYEVIATNFRPDHLAILPDGKGACSISDGAGLLRLNEAGLPEWAMKAALAAGRLLMNADKSFGEISESLYKLIATGGPNTVGDAWVNDVYDRYFVYSKGGKLFQESYTVDKDGVVALAGDAAEVMRVSSYEPVTNAGDAMLKKQIVDNLITNGGWSETDRKFLDGLSDDQLSKVAVVRNSGTPVAEPAKPATAPAVPAVPAATTEPAPAKTLEQVLAEVPPAMAEVIQSGIATNASRKASLVAALVANKANPYSKEALEAKPLAELELLTSFAANSVPAQPAVPYNRPLNYSGAAAPVANSGGTKVEALELPTINFGTADGQAA